MRREQFFYFLKMFIFRERERVSEHRGGSETEGENPKLTDCTKPDVSLDLMNDEIMTGAKIKSWTLNQLSHLGTTTAIFLKTKQYIFSPHACGTFILYFFNENFSFNWSVVDIPIGLWKKRNHVVELRENFNRLKKV